MLIHLQVAMFTACQCEQPFFIFWGSDFHGVDEMERILDASVEALPQDAPALQFRRRNAEHAGQMSRQCRLRLVDAQAQIGNADGHAVLWSAAARRRFLSFFLSFLSFLSHGGPLQRKKRKKAVSSHRTPK